MAFLYPEFHYFADGQTGIRIEQSDIDQGSVKILPYTMDTLLKANDQIWKKKDSSECQKCQKSLRRRSDCQTADWNEHKKLCKVFTEVKWFTDKDWVSGSVKNFRF
ncbi:hypothetical protein FPQ18DRAFT_383391 [Pyronema domesticum]|nr:hypothetical protein FPQ18DRAFT_383391 [Pyronema domesticum]